MHRGFSLIELMVAVVIIAILASFAIPAYNDYVIRGKLQQAISGLSDGRIKLEQYFQDKRTYSGATSPCPAATEYFGFTCTNLSATTYTITATGAGNLSAYVYTIDQSNVKTSTTPFSDGTMLSCWVTKRGEGC